MLKNAEYWMQEVAQQIEEKGTEGDFKEWAVRQGYLKSKDEEFTLSLLEKIKEDIQKKLEKTKGAAHEALLHRLHQCMAAIQFIKAANKKERSVPDKKAASVLEAAMDMGVEFVAKTHKYYKEAGIATPEVMAGYSASVLRSLGYEVDLTKLATVYAAVDEANELLKAAGFDAEVALELSNIIGVGFLASLEG